jgi:hypothetical protein
VVTWFPKPAGLFHGNLFSGTLHLFLGILFGNLFLEPLLGNLFLVGMRIWAAPTCSETCTVAEDPKLMLLEKKRS